MKDLQFVSKHNDFSDKVAHFLSNTSFLDDIVKLAEDRFLELIPELKTLK